MNKPSHGRFIAALIFFVLTVGAGVTALIYVISISPNADLRPFGNSLIWTTFLDTNLFRIENVFPDVLFNYGAIACLYLAALMFLVAIIVVLVRGARFFFLPFGGAFAMAVASYLILAYRFDKDIAILLLAIACGVLGFLSLVLSYTLPHRRVKATKEKPLPEKVEEAKPEEPKPEEPKVEEVKPEEAPAPVAEETKQEPEPEAKEEPEPEAKEEPVPEEKQEEAVSENLEEKPAIAEPIVAEKGKKISGKYEVFPEAGFYKYRLKANNGEILIVSNPYRTIESALAGIETLKKNVPVGRHKVITDKNGYGQFRIITPNDSRVVAMGEIYPSAAGAEKALNSVLKFYDSDKVVVLDDIPETEHREWPLTVGALEPKNNGRLQVQQLEDGKFQATLFANNGELLFSTTTYSSRSALTKALENITRKLLSGKSVTIAKDKQNRFQFRLYSDNGMLLLMGETYPSLERASSAAHSARNFIKDAKVA
ncbi:MAG: DUF1508 domain-containing protein [Bacilli bacterium]|nr:DUF1508 domain-containing protein [Bacilli bacterium]